MITDLRKMSNSKNAYGFYKKLGWKSSFIKYREQKEVSERQQLNIVEKVLQIQRERDEAERNLKLKLKKRAIAL